MRHRALRGLSAFVGRLLGVALRVVVTSIAFTTCVVILLRSLGVPMPSADQLLRQFEGLSKFAKILS